MDHTCKNCIHSKDWDYPIENIGSCDKLKQIKQAAGEIRKDFIS